MTINKRETKKQKITLCIIVFLFSVMSFVSDILRSQDTDFILKQNNPKRLIIHAYHSSRILLNYCMQDANDNTFKRRISKIELSNTTSV